MHLPWLMPVFDNRTSLFGVPATVVVGALAFAGMIGGFLWLRRIIEGEGEYRSFRATDRPRSAVAVAVVAIGAIAIIVLVAQRLA